MCVSCFYMCVCVCESISAPVRVYVNIKIVKEWKMENIWSSLSVLQDRWLKIELVEHGLINEPSWCTRARDGKAMLISVDCTVPVNSGMKVSILTKTSYYGLDWCEGWSSTNSEAVVNLVECSYFGNKPDHVTSQVSRLIRVTCVTVVE